MKTNLKSLFGGDFRQVGMIAALALFFQVKTDGKVFQAQNLMNLVMGNTYVLVLAMGMVLVIIAGHMDLSVGSVAATVGIVVAVAMRDWNLNPWIAILLGIAVGILIGTWQGFWVAQWGIPAFIVTLGGMLLFRGVNQLIGMSLTVPVPELFQTLGAGYLPDIAPEVIPFNLPTMVLAVIAVAALAWSELRSHRQAKGFEAEPTPLWVPVTRIVVLGGVILGFAWIFATGRPGTSFPIPGVIVLVLVLIAVYHLVFTRTAFGRHVRAIGGNARAAALSGVDVERVKILVLANMGPLSALAGLMFAGRSTAAGPQDGLSWELDAIAAVFIGGAAVAGGRGSVFGAVLGATLMAVLANGLLLVGIGSDRAAVIKGLVLLVAVIVDAVGRRRSDGEASSKTQFTV